MFANFGGVLFPFNAGVKTGGKTMDILILRFFFLTERKKSKKNEKPT